MIQKIKTFANIWIQGYEVDVEVDSSKSLPSIEIVWLPDTTIKESKERIRAALKNFWIDLPPRKIILNLAPSDLKKNWTRFDLPMLVAIFLMIMDWNIYNKEDLENFIFFWELWLDGKIKRVNWLLPSVISALQRWYKTFFVPYENYPELKYVEGINIYLVDSVKDIIDFFQEWKEINFVEWGVEDLDSFLSSSQLEVDFADIKWQLFAKRALSVAAAGFHNILMSGSPWCWKSLLSKALQWILPPLNFDEILEISQIYSILWKLWKENPLVNYRPFRSVHHTASSVSIIWGGGNLSPGEISLAHKWILFFDELPEFDRQLMEVLRQPLENRKVTISRVNGVVDYPAEFMFVAAMNPCKCWYYKDPEKSCKCSLNEIKRYQSKISWPILDRFDMILEIPRENIDKILDKWKEESSEQIRERINRAWYMQQKRYKDLNININSQLTSKEIDSYLKLDNESESFLKKSIKALNLSPRVIHRIMKLSRSIADIDWSNDIKTNHIAESLQYRSKSMFVENM